MKFTDLMKMEFMKIRRSKIILILMIPALLVIITGMASISGYIGQQSGHAWEMMFVQSSLMYSYYLMPLSLVVICTMMLQREYGGRGIIKTLTLPINPQKVSLAKMTMIFILLFAELLLYFMLFIAAGIITGLAAGIEIATPIGYLGIWCIKLFLSAVPMAAVFWLLCVSLVKPILTLAASLVLILPGILISNIPVLKLLYPFNYPGVLVTEELGRLSGSFESENMFIISLAGVLITVIAVCISGKKFGRGAVE
ncbi:MAG: ABC transporter permease [Clostridiales bacterium]|nr:ABC transporter permease [Clostridiales bacterium]